MGYEYEEFIEPVGREMRPVIIGGQTQMPWLYDSADFPGFIEAQIVAGLITPACGKAE